jgi:predicted enzyme related to lactoylglutathione lyase
MVVHGSLAAIKGTNGERAMSAHTNHGNPGETGGSGGAPAANAAPAGGFQLRHATHLLLEVGDMARSVTFFRDTLGMTVKSVSPKWTEFEAGGVSICLQPADERQPSPRCNTEIVFSVDDADAAVALLNARGVTFDVEPTPICSEGGKAYRWARLRDPDGHAIGFYSKA